MPSELVKKSLILLLPLALTACIKVLPMEPEEIILSEDTCKLFITLEVVRGGNVYMTNELDIFSNQLGLDCRRVNIREEWVEMAPGVLLLWTYETWDCYSCPAA